MELLESQDPDKRRLIETSDRHRHELEKEVKQISDKTERAVKNALIIGGVLAASFLIVTQLSSHKKKKKAKAKLEASADPDQSEEDLNQPPSMLAQIGAKVADTATLVLLDLAKDALADFLKNRKQKDDNS